MPIELTPDEIAFLLAILNQISVKPTSPDALASVHAVQSLMTKLEPKGE